MNDDPLGQAALAGQKLEALAVAVVRAAEQDARALYDFGHPGNAKSYHKPDWENAHTWRATADQDGPEDRPWRAIMKPAMRAMLEFLEQTGVYEGEQPVSKTAA